VAWPAWPGRDLHDVDVLASARDPTADGLGTVAYLR
jgi:hypothetical protein